MAYLPHYKPNQNLMEYGFRDIKSIAMKKNIYGECEELQSLIESTERLEIKDYTHIMKRIRYIR